MSTIEDTEKTQKFSWGRWITLFCGLSFLMLGLDALLNHRQIIAVRAFSLIPIVFAPLCLAYCIVAFFNQMWRRLAWIPGLAAVAVGLAGTLFHVTSAIRDRYDQTIMQAILESSRPPLAPAAFASTGILLLFVAWAARRS